MDYVPIIATIITVIVIPWVVQLIKTETVSPRAASWLAVIISVIAGGIIGLASGIPESAQQWLVLIFTVIGGVQVAYMAFKAVGVTNKWLDALLEVRLGGKVE